MSESEESNSNLPPHLLQKNISKKCKETQKDRLILMKLFKVDGDLFNKTEKMISYNSPL